MLNVSRTTKLPQYQPSISQLIESHVALLNYFDCFDFAEAQKCCFNNEIWIYIQFYKGKYIVYVDCIPEHKFTAKTIREKLEAKGYFLKDELPKKRHSILFL